MSSSPCPFSHLDGAYVLGSLTPADRQEFEQHLAGCADCSRSVRELAGLPGLLARIERDVLESPRMVTPVPDTLLPGLVRQVRRTQRRRLLVTASAAAAAAAAIAVGSLALAGALGDGETPSATHGVPPGQVMLPVGQSAVSASLTLESVAWGTRLDLTCSYEPGAGWDEPAHAPTYSLLVHTRDGRTEQVATWRALPGRTMQLTGATSASRADIESVDVLTADGRTILELTA